ncbi:MAG TPA: MG2 domain-containing protein [Longimicrobium sp.]|nr:MG2 domain-containing protein [Longimicrobium sp.]
MAQPEAVVTVTFDRPVAGGLDEMVDAESLFRIEPAVEGRTEWRDPVTLRFTPAAPLRPGTTYTVTVASDFAAMDGARLPRPHRFSFRVERARVLTGWPVGPDRIPRFLEPEPRFFLLLSSAADPAGLAGRARLELDPSCEGPATVALRGVAVRPIGEQDPEWVGYFGATGNDSARDLRRVVELAPARPLPPGCAGQLVVPQGMDESTDEPHAWRFSTYGPLRVVEGGCPKQAECHYGPAVLQFSTPVRGAEVMRHVHLDRDRPFTVRDTAAEQDRWTLEGRLHPRRAYTITVDPGLTDAFGQRLGTAARIAFTTPGVPPSVMYPHGKLVVEREGFRTLAVQHVNVDTLEVDVAAVPDSLEGRLLSRGWGGWEQVWTALAPSAERRRIPVRGERDRSAVTGVALAAPDARRRPRGTLLLVQVGGRGVDSAAGRHPLALVQVTDLAVHARVGVDQAAVWVTGVGDGRPRGGVDVTLHDGDGRVRATGRTDRRGVVLLTGFRPSPPPPAAACAEGAECVWTPPVEGYVAAQRGEDRAVVGISEYDPDLSPYRFGLDGAWGEERAPAAGAVFTERGIYRPGEPVHAKAIVRRGPLGALAPPAPGDSLRWIFTGREGEPLGERTAALSRFGTADHTFRLPAGAALGDYGVEIRMRRDGQWRQIGYAGYQVAEYRPPEFLVEVAAHEEPRFAGDRLRTTVGARYLFGAPMARAPVRWTARQAAVSPWELQIPGTDGWYLGDSGEWWEDAWEAPVVLAGGTDTLDARGYRELEVALPALADGRPARVTVQAEVMDANRQTVAGSASVLVHPADFYLGARPEGSGYFWTAGTPVRVGVIAVRPDGRSVAGVAVQGAVVRREWHVVRRQRGGAYDEVGEWVSDTVATCRLTTAAHPAACAFTPGAGGAYTVSFTATDGRGRTASTAFTRWTVGGDWVPWNDEGKFKMDVIPDRERYSPGDTATVLVASPFTDAEAWVTVERERVLEQRRIRITSGTHTLKIPITEAFAPNAFVSVVVVRGRSAPPGTVDDPGRPTLRVGYTQLRVTPEVKRLAVEVAPLQPEYRPGDSARIRVRVRDGAGRGQVSEVTLWAVDEGVLSLTGYRTPDPLELLYQPRGVGMRLASNLVAVAPQVPEGQKGTRDPGGDGGQDLTGILRSRFRPTAFFIGSVVTDRNGEAVVAGGLPDNVTTFRVMAVAVTAGDRYGAGESPLLSTRPLIARPALPRFLREGDDVMAGVVVNHRFARGVEARVTAEARGVTLTGGAERTVSLLTGRGAEARFRFGAPVGDSAVFRFGVTGNGETDAVEVRVPVFPANRPVVQTSAGVLRDTATVEFILPAEVDPARSSLQLGFGTSPLALVQAYNRRLELYPYACTEQISSQALPLIALYRARREGGEGAGAEDGRARIELVVRTLAARQRPDGGIGLWSALDWTSPFLTAYAGRVMLEARAAGVEVSDTVLNRMAGYLAGALGEPEVMQAVLGPGRLRVDAVLAERVAAADFLSRLGQPDVPAENQLLGQAARLSWEDRLALAEMLARRGAMEPARRLLAAAWEGVQLRGARAVLPESAYRRDFYFASHVRPAARLLTATLAVQPGHPGIGALVETLVQQGRAEARLPWTTQDYGAAVLALLRFEENRRGAPERAIRLLQGGRTVLETRARRGERRDSVPGLAGLLVTLPDGRRALRLALEAPGEGVPVYYDLSVREIVSRPAFTPLDRGIAVERWYETLDTRRPVTSVVEGQVVRVRLRITVPEERQMVILDDPLPAGLEAVDLSLRTISPFPAGEFDEGMEEDVLEELEESVAPAWSFGSWDSGLWSAFDHREIRDDRVVYFARVLWRGAYGATYLARATTAGRFTMAPAHAEEMYNPGVHGRSGGGAFTITPAAP